MTKLGRSISFIINIVLILLLLTACVEENNRYPRLEYIPTMWRSDAINIKLEDGYNLIFSFEATDDVCIIIIYAQSYPIYKVEDHIIYNLKKKCKCGEKK